MRKRLTSAARCAIKMCSQECDRVKAIKQFEKDLINGPSHCFGYHDRCSADFCHTVRDKQSQSNEISAELNAEMPTFEVANV